MPVRSLFAVTLLLAFESQSLAATACVSDAAVSAPPRQDVELQATQQAVANLETSSAPALIVGDSFAAQWGTFFPGAAFDFGYGGDRTQQILWRIEQVDKNVSNFKTVILSAGANDSGGHYSGCEVAGGVLAIVDQLKLKFPQAKIVVLSMLPRGVNLSERDETIQQSNAIVKAAATENGFVFVDAYAKIRETCGYDDSCSIYMAGKLHLRPAGYAILNALIQPYLPR
jgi:lysophospholipase L1-like esterase